MIQAKELMIGNYLYCEYSGEIIQVTEIKNDGVYASSNKTVIERYYYYEEIHSIPIDEKWLTDFGFDISKSPSTWATKIELDYGMSNEYQIFKNEVSIVDYSFIYFRYKFITRVEYIHQLQNLYFALTGEELELKQNMK
jgi:hypothetical protein